MNTVFPGEENINISDNYFIFLKQISEEYLKYISNYKLATGEYLKKLSLNHEKFSPKLMETNSQLKDIGSNHIISLTSIVPKVVEQQMINIEYFVEGFDEKLEKFEKLMKEKIIEYTDYQNFFKETKNELIKKYKEIEKIKGSIISKINI